MAIRVVVCDLGNVLFHSDHDRLVSTLKSHSPLRDVEIVEQIPYHDADGWVYRYDQGDISTRDFLNELRERLKIYTSDEELARLWASTLSLNEPMAELVKILKARGYILWVISNINELHRKYLDTAYPAVMDLFHGKTYSYDERVRVLKPHPFIYCYTFNWLQAITSLDLMPDQCVFIDDVKANVRAAEALGWKAIRHQSAAITKYHLYKLGVTVE